MENQDDAKKGRKEGRSPGYPSIDLATALERARQIKDAEQRHFAPLDAVMKHWGYASKSGPVQTTWSALIKFGLLETKGTGDERQGRISDLAWGILIDEREDSPEKMKAIQEAALNPVIHQKLWTRYEGNLPSDETFRIHLLRDYKFTEGAVKDFIKQFKSTMSFAKLEKSDNLLGHEEDNELPITEEMMIPVPQNTARAEAPRPPLVAPKGSDQRLTTETIQFPLAPKKWVTVQLPSELTEEEWKLITTKLDVFKSGFVVERDNKNGQ